MSTHPQARTHQPTHSLSRTHSFTHSPPPTPGTSDRLSARSVRTSGPQAMRSSPPCDSPVSAPTLQRDFTGRTDATPCTQRLRFVDVLCHTSIIFPHVYAGDGVCPRHLLTENFCTSPSMNIKLKHFVRTFNQRTSNVQEHATIHPASMYNAMHGRHDAYSVGRRSDFLAYVWPNPI